MLRNRRPHLAGMLFLLTCVVPLAAAQPAPPAAATQPAPRERFDPADVIPDAALRRIYQRELGPTFKPDAFKAVRAAHLLIERFFDAPSATERKVVQADLEKMRLDVNLLGRLARVRMNWPALEGGGVYYVNERLGPHRVRYFLGVPAKYERTRPWPLVVRLPGAHAFTTKPPPGPEEVSRIYTAWIEEELARHPDAIVLMPLLNFDELYGPSYDGMNGAFQPVRHAYGRVNLDPARVYLVGHSMAAHAVWNLGLHYPTYFAAINPLAGAATGDWQRLRLMNLRNVLPVVWHDVDDEVLKVNFSRQIVKAIRGLKLDVDYEETKGLGHAPGADVAERAYGKMIARVRDIYPPEVYLQSNRPDVVFNRVDWVQVYQPLSPGKEQRLLFHHGTGFMTVHANAWHVQAVRPGSNRVQALSRNVATMRFYFNDQTVNFREPVVITVNKKPRFEGMLKPSLDTMLKDQLFLGRGWRYFTAVVDVDLAPPPATRPVTRPATKPAVTKPAP